MRHPEAIKLARISFVLLALFSWVAASQGQTVDQLTTGVKKGDKTSLEKLGSLAERGNLNAQFNLAFVYQHGEGVAKDPQKAFDWYLIAARRGHPSAQFNVSELYLKGEGVSKDIVWAYVWRRLAEGKEDPKTANSSTIAKQLNKAQLSRANKLIKDWKPKR